MDIIKLLAELAGIGNKLMEGRKRRARMELENLKIKKDRILALPATISRAKSLKKIEDRIEYLKIYLGAD